MSKAYKHGRLTIGVLAGWQVYHHGGPNSFLDPLFRGIYSAARDRGCNLLLACGVTVDPNILLRVAWPVLTPETDFVPVGPWNTDGLIVVTPLLSPDRSREIQAIVTAGHPVVFVGAGQGSPLVTSDNVGGIRQALTHLVEHGHRRIAFIAGYEEDDEGDGRDRLNAYRSLVKEYGLDADTGLIAYGLHSSAGGHRAMQKLLDSGTPFTAVLASNDDSALGVMQALQQSGRRIPQDIAVVGFDDRLELAVLEPRLTSVHYPIVEAGYRALELALAYVAGQTLADTVLKVPTRLVIRQSCGCELGGLPSKPPTSLRRSAEQTHRSSAAAEGGVLGERLAHVMSESVFTESRQLTPEEVLRLCRRLVESFSASLERADPAGFRATLEEIIQRAEGAEDDPYAWQAAISVLRAAAPALLQTPRGSPLSLQAEDLLDQARIAINEGTRRNHTRYVIGQRWMADQVGHLAARLLAAVDEAQILKALNERLLEMNIQHVRVATFEPAARGDDPVAWSVLRGHAQHEAAPRRFPSRDFPPTGLYPTEAPFHLALLPMVIKNEMSGYVTFSPADLGLCATIAWQLAVALKSAQLHRLKNRFLSTVSHELRTPLNLIVGLSEVLLRELSSLKPASPDQYRGDVERIHASAKLLDALIRDVLDLSQSEMGQLQLLREPLNLSEVLGPVAQAGEQLAREKGLVWQAELPEDLPRIWGDRNRLRQVALNLVSNAVKFTAHGTITLEVKRIDDLGLLIADSNNQQSAIPKGLSVSNQQSKDWISVSVSDTGLGIPPVEQSEIFDEFHQSERTTARGYGGLGLGLAICKKLIELHGGQIGVWSSGQEGEGSTFYFRLPILKPLSALVETPLQTRKVALLTEPAADAEHLRERLTEQGFEVETILVGEATDWLTPLLMAPPGAVVLGPRPASQRGWELMKALKENPATEHIPVLFYSFAEQADTGAWLELDYLTKPMGTAELAQALARRGLLTNGDQVKTILIVDDDPGILEMHTRVVEAQLPACRVLQARDGQAALEIIEQARPDLVLLDLMMPGLDGFGVLERMRERAGMREVPVIVLTAQVLSEEDMARLNDGVAAVLSKGLFSARETLAHLEAALARHSQLGGEAQRLVRRVMAYLHTHYAEPITRASLAQYVSVNEDHLTRSFRQETGLTPMTYLRRLRLNKAKALLTLGDKSVAEVARAVGFSDNKYFDQCFRREVGVSPGAYRRGGGPVAGGARKKPRRKA